MSLKFKKLRQNPCKPKQHHDNNRGEGPKANTQAKKKKAREFPTKKDPRRVHKILVEKTRKKGPKGPRRKENQRRPNITKKTLSAHNLPK